jgi:hypothetical protein
MCSVKEMVKNNHEEKDQNHERFEKGQIACTLGPLYSKVGIEKEKNTYPEYGENYTNDDLTNLNVTIHRLSTSFRGGYIIAMNGSGRHVSIRFCAFVF